MRHSKIWELENDTSVDEELIESLTPEGQQKYPAYKKPERPRSSFVSEWSLILTILHNLYYFCIRILVYYSNKLSQVARNINEVASMIELFN